MSGLHWEANEGENSVASLRQQCESLQPVVQDLKNAVISLQNDIGSKQPLAGQAYQKLSSSLDEVFVPILKSLDFLC